MYASLAIEGGIGAGKTTFSTWLAQDLGAELMLERFEENPFLEKFYENPEAHAFSVELSFLADRYKQMQGAIKSRNLFRQRLVADYSFAKSLIFAKVNLPKDEFKLFNTMFQMMAAQLPQPEIIAILDPGTNEARSPNRPTRTRLRAKPARGLPRSRGQRLRIPLPSPPRLAGAVGGHLGARLCGTAGGIARLA